MLNDLLFRLRSLFSRESLEAAMNEELRFHFEQQVAKLRQSGITEEEARRRARLVVCFHEANDGKRMSIGVFGVLWAQPHDARRIGAQKVRQLLGVG